MSQDKLEDEVFPPLRDSLQRPLPAHLVPEMPSAGDVMLASFSQRFLAFIIDMVMICLMFYGVLLLLQVNHIILSSAGLTSIFAALWGGYIVLFSVSARHATIGQLLLGIHLYSLFSGKISIMVASVRFVIFALPVIVMLYMTMGYMAEYVPMVPPVDSDAPESFFLVMTVAGLAQALMLWPLISGHYRRVVWDSSLRCAVVRKRIF